MVSQVSEHSTGRQ
jgi:hypothetical protein